MLTSKLDYDAWNLKNLQSRDDVWKAQIIQAETLSPTKSFAGQSFVKTLIGIGKVCTMKLHCRMTIDENQIWK